MSVLTDVAIRSLKPGVYYDDRTPGFGIRIGVRTKTFIVQKGRGRVKMALGHYPALSLADARKKALVALGSPLEAKSTITFTEAKEAFLSLDRWRPASKRVIESSLRPFIWTRPLAKITFEDVAQAIEAIEKPSARAHALKDLRTFFNWCIPRYISSSPCIGLKMEPQPSRSRVLSDDELKAVWMAAEQIGYPYGDIVRMLILSLQRRGEIGALQPSWLTDDTLTIPADVAKNGRQHTIPLSPLLKELATSFASKRGSPFTAWSKSQAALLKLSGTSGWTPHDLRRSGATRLAALDVPIHVTERILNHTSGTISGVAAIYNRHSYFEEMKSALTLYEAHLQSLLKSE